MARTHSIPKHTRVPEFAFLLALALALLAGCDWTTRSTYRDRLSAVNAVSTPDSVALGASIGVSISTWGPNGCWRKGHDSAMRPNTLLVTISPYDREYTGTGACTQNIVEFEHFVPITGATTRGKLRVDVHTRLRDVSGKDSTGTITKYVRVY